MKVDPPWLPYLTIMVFIVGFFLAFMGNIEYNDPEMGRQSFFEKFVQLPPNAIGDTLAGFFGFLAFIAAIFALVFQRKELELTRLEAAKSASALQAQVHFQTTTAADQHVDQLVEALRHEVVKDIENLQRVTWIYEPSFSGKFAAVGTQHAFLPKELSLKPAKPEFFADAQNVLEDLIVRLTALDENCEPISLPSGYYYRMANSEIISMRIRILSDNTSAAKRQHLKNTRVNALCDAIRQINTGHWWHD